MHAFKLPIYSRAALFYGIFGILWILLSDLALELLISDSASITQFQTYKGWFFILVSTTLLYFSLKNEVDLRKIIEIEHDHTEILYRKLFESSVDAILLTAPDGRIFAANPAACEIFQYTEAEIIQGGRSGLVDKLDPRLEAALEERSKTGIFKGELTFMRKDGQKFPGELTTTLYYISEGKLRSSMIIRDVTQRKQMEKSLQDSEDRFRAIFEAANVGKSITSPAGKIFVNKAFAEMLGYSQKELNGRNWRELTPEEEIDAIEENLGKLLDGRSDSSRFEKRYIHKNGYDIWTDVSVATKRDDDGSPQYLITTVIDIQDQKQAEEALLRSENVLRLFVEYSPAAVAMFDREMKYIVASRRYFQDYRIEDLNITGRSHYEVFPEMPERWKEIHRKCLAGAVERAEKDSFPRADGSLDWVRWEIHPWYESKDKIGGIILLSEVITDRVIESERLQESEERYRKLVEVAPVGVAVHSEGRLVFTNQAGANIIGANQPGDMLGKPIWGFIHPDYREAARDRIQRLVAGEKGLYPVEDLFLNLEGGPVPVEVFAVPLSYDGKPAIQVLIQDISERKRAEDEIRLSNERLIELSRRLVEAHEREQRSIGRELHDQIGQLLTALKITLDLMWQLPPEDAPKKIAQAQELIDDLFTRVSQLTLELRPQMLDDLGLIPALQWHIIRYLDQTGIEVDFEHTGIDGVRFALEVETTAYRVVQEALTNIARHAKAAHVRISIGVSAGKMKIQIEDNGRGFDPEKAFEQYRGLSGMRERVRLVGGSMDVTSEISMGARIFAEIPLEEENL